MENMIEILAQSFIPKIMNWNEIFDEVALFAHYYITSHENASKIVRRLQFNLAPSRNTGWCFDAHNAAAMRYGAI